MSDILIHDAEKLVAKRMWAHDMNCHTAERELEYWACDDCRTTAVVVFTDPVQDRGPTVMATNLAALWAVEAAKKEPK